MKSFLFNAVAAAALLGDGRVSARQNAPLAARQKEVCTVYRTKYLVPIPGPGYVTRTRPYTGTVPITAPTTVTTIPPTGTKPGTVIIETPGPASDVPPRQTVTITRPYTGMPPITAPITSTTITPAASTEPITVVIATPRGIVTVTRPYTGTPAITAPVTTSTETPANVDQPLTVVVETPGPKRETITATRPYTGTPAITAPVTTSTNTPADPTAPITVVVETPAPASSSSSSTTTTTTSTPTSTSTSTTTSKSTTSSTPTSTTSTATRSTVTVTTEYNGTGVITAPVTTSTNTPTDTASPVTVVVETPPPKFGCDVHGYLISDNALYKVDLAKGTEDLVKSGLDGGGGHINAIGYNPLDNYIYGISGSQDDSAPRLVRIDSKGRTKIIGTVPAQIAGANKFWFTGDIDQDGYLWASGNGDMWIKIDLKPGSSTFGKVVDQGTSGGIHKYRANDWVYVPGQEGKLFSVLQSLTGKGSLLAYFDTGSKKWTTRKDFGKLVGNDQWGALYVGHDGTIYGSENDSGEIWKFKPDGSTPTKFSSGPTSKLNDGARCANAPDVA